MKTHIKSWAAMAVLIFAAACAGDDKGGPEVYPPWTAPQRALHKALWISEMDSEKRLGDVVLYLEGKQSAGEETYATLFTRAYLKAWSSAQMQHMKTCKGDDCEIYSFTCNPFSKRDALNHRKIPYAYRTVREGAEEATVSFAPQKDWDGKGGTFRLRKEGEFWKVDATPCD